MMEIHVVDADNRSAYSDALKQLAVLRHDAFVVEKGWLPASDDGRECDQFDTDAAIYLLGLSAGRVLASARLRRMNHPTLLSEVFPSLCASRPVPETEEWAEWTRSLVVPSARMSGLRGAAGQMACAVMSYCIGVGVRYVGGVQETRFLALWRRLDWTVVRLGPERLIGGDRCIAAFVECTPEALASARRRVGP